MIKKTEDKLMMELFSLEELGRVHVQHISKIMGWNQVHLYTILRLFIWQVPFTSISPTVIINGG